MSLIFDTHAHYDDSAFDNDRDEILSALQDKQVFKVVNAGSDISSSLKSILLSQKYNYIYAAIGVHPQNADSISGDSYILQLENMIINNKKVVAIGEIGLDYHYNSENKETQVNLFENQIKLALKYDLPVIVHDWDAHSDTLSILKHLKPKGIVHCFSGSLEMAREIIKIGMHIGIGGVITFKNAKNAAIVVKEIPLSNIVLETDAPYLAPAPLRGKRCDSSLIKFTAEKVAELKNLNVSEVLKITKENAMSLFKIKN